jgi:hypothetical protein
VIAGAIDTSTCCFRLTLETNVPVSVTDQLAKTTLYATPYHGNRIGIDGAVYASAEFSITNAGLAANTVFDVFAYIAAGVPALELLAWSTGTARATALAVHSTDGYLCKSGAETRRYLGTIVTDAASKFNIRFDGGVKAGAESYLGVWNYYNKKIMTFDVNDDTDSWTYATGAWRSYDNNVQNRFQMVMGINEEPTVGEFCAYAAVSGVGTRFGIGLDSTSALDAHCKFSATYIDTHTMAVSACVLYSGNPGLGSHYLQLLEYALIGSYTAYGDGGAPTIIKTGAVFRVMA